MGQRLWRPRRKTGSEMELKAIWPLCKLSQCDIYEVIILLLNKATIMVRACCVNNCKSGDKVPSHGFPKNPERRNKWFLNLCMKPLENESELKKLRVCYKHFRDEDYSGSSRRRVLIHHAVPHINVPQQELVEENVSTKTVTSALMDATQIEHEKHHQEQNQKEHEKQEALLQTERHITCVQKRQQEQLDQHTIQLQECNERLVQQQEEIENIKTTLKIQMTQSSTRPNLKEVTRKKLLSPKARKFYEQVVKLKKHKSRLQKQMKLRKKHNLTQSIQLRTTNHKGNVDPTAYMRQQFVNMIMRNNEKAPQVFPTSVNSVTCD